MASCEELARDDNAVERIQTLYETLEKSATPSHLLLPWLPLRAKKNKENATRDLFTTLYDYVELRRKSNVPSADAIDLLLAEGTEPSALVQVSFDPVVLLSQI